MKHFSLLLAFIFGLHVISHAQENAADAERLQNTYKHAFDLLEKLDTDSTAIKKMDSVLMVAREALKKSPTNPSKEQLTYYIAMKGGLIQLYIATGNASEAYNTIAELLSFARKHNDTATIVRYEYYHGGMCVNLGKLQEATMHYQESTKAALTIRDYDMAATSQSELATVYNTLNRFNDALTAARHTIEYGKLNNNNNIQIGNGWQYMGLAYKSLEQYDQAIAALKSAATHYEKGGSKDLLHITQSAIDQILTQTGRKKTVVEKIVASEQLTKKREFETIDTIDPTLKNSYEVIKTQQKLTELDAADKQAKLEVLREDYIDKQTQALRAQVWYISGLSLLVIVALILLYARQRQKRRAEIEKTQKYIAGLENERERISKELHDGVCNDLLAIELALKESGIEAEKVEPLRRSRESVRNISHELLPPEFQYATIDEILSDYTFRLKADKITINYQSTQSENWSRVTKEVAFTIYRIVQEAVSNSIKHSGATTIEVELCRTEENLSVAISDNGTGMHAVQKSKGTGLQIIKERVKSAGGELDVESSEQGTVIKATFHV